MIISENKKVVTTKFVCADPRLRWTIVTSKGDEMSLNLHGNMDKKSTLKERQFHERSFEGEVCMTLT